MLREIFGLKNEIGLRNDDLAKLKNLCEQLTNEISQKQKYILFLIIVMIHKNICIVKKGSFLV